MRWARSSLWVRGRRGSIFWLITVAQSNAVPPCNAFAILCRHFLSYNQPVDLYLFSLFISRIPLSCPFSLTLYGLTPFGWTLSDIFFGSHSALTVTMSTVERGRSHFNNGTARKTFRMRFDERPLWQRQHPSSPVFQLPVPLFFSNHTG